MDGSAIKDLALRQGAARERDFTRDQAATQHEGERLIARRASPIYSDEVANFDTSFSSGGAVQDL